MPEEIRPSWIRKRLELGVRCNAQEVPVCIDARTVRDGVHKAIWDRNIAGT